MTKKVITANIEVPNGSGKKVRIPTNIVKEVELPDTVDELILKDDALDMYKKAKIIDVQREIRDEYATANGLKDSKNPLIQQFKALMLQIGEQAALERVLKAANAEVESTEDEA